MRWLNRSILTKLMATHMVVLLAALSGIGVLSTHFTKNYLIGAKENELVSHGYQLSRYAASYFLGALTSEELVHTLDVANAFVGAEVWIVDSDGLVTSLSRGGGRLSLGPRRMGPGNGPRMGQMQRGVKLPPAMVAQVLQGQVVKTVGSNPYFDQPMVSVAVPVIVSNPSGDQGTSPILGAVFLHAPVVGLVEVLSQLRQYLLISLLLGLVVAGVLSYLFWRVLFQPLRELREAALAVANGRYDTRVHITTGDEIQKLGEAFNYLAGEVGRLESLRRQFVADVSHELRTPLTAIRGYNEAIADGTAPDPATRAKYHQIIREEVERLERLVGDLLELSRLQSGHIPLAREAVDLRELAEGAAFRLRPEFDKKDIKLITTFPPELEAEGLIVWADGDRIMQVLLIFLSNALKFTPPGGQVTLAVQRVGTGQQNQVKVSVIDTGPGISPEDQDRIWERFYKVDKARTPGTGGTGLGLAIAKRIIEIHGGIVGVTSELGRGACFFFILPGTKQCPLDS